jgi:hypothetical protein
MAHISKVYVDSTDAMESSITGYVAMGFLIVNKTATKVTLQKKREFSILWAVIGIIFCLIPLFIYLIVYATKPAVEVVEIEVRGTTSNLPRP